MAKEIMKSYEPIGYSLIAELSAANVMFWLSHKSAASVFLFSGEENSLVKSELFGKTLSKELYAFFCAEGIGESYAKERVMAIKALLMGYVILIGSGELPSSEETFSGIKTQVDKPLFSSD